VLVDVPQSLLEDRRRKGHDVFDEMWEGVLHMVPAPSSRHQRLEYKLESALEPAVEARGFVILHETGLYRPGTGNDDYRIPDLIVADASAIRARGVEGRVELAVEIRSPNDETYDKLDFYSEVGVQELLVIDLDPLSVELFELTDNGLIAVPPRPPGTAIVRSLGVTITVDTDDGTVQLEWAGGTTRVPTVLA